MSVYILLLTFFLRGGTVMTQSILMPDDVRATCETYKVQIISDYKKNVISLSGTDLPLEHLIGLCIKVDSN